jgi:hypothetical protein
MSQNKNPKMSRPNGGVVNDILTRVKLVIRLMGDKRVSPLLKLIPIGSLAYFVIPDLVIGPIDDALIIWLATYLFVELAPADVVQEHMAHLNKVVPGEWQDPKSKPDKTSNDPNVIDAEFWEEDK